MHKQIITNIVIYSEPQSQVFQQAGYFVGGGVGGSNKCPQFTDALSMPYALYIVSENMWKRELDAFPRILPFCYLKALTVTLCYCCIQQLLGIWCFPICLQVCST